MNKKYLALASMMFLFVWIFLTGFQTIAYAIPVSFGDSSIYWPGWQNGSSDDTKDTIGIPNFTGGIVNISPSGTLQSLVFNYTGSSGLSYWYVLKPGDLFIDTNADNVWDYVVELNYSTAAGTYNLYSVSIPLNASSYEMSGKDNQGQWCGFYIRDDHPVGYDTSGLNPVGQVYFSGWQKPSSPGEIVSSVFQFTTDDINLGPQFVIAWTANCANDVVYETVAHPVPEPTTLLLLGVGLIGLAGVGRKLKED